MVRRSTPYSKVDDRTFAVRMRVKTESGGRVPRIMDIQEFLRHAGPHALHTGSPGLYIYAEDPKIIIDCMNQFDLRLLSFKKETP